MVDLKSRLETYVKDLRCVTLSMSEYRTIAAFIEEYVLPLVERHDLEMRARAWQMVQSCECTSVEDRISAANKLIAWLKQER
jgi:hypothetical protein